MAYNKAREERKWSKWKEKEERQLRIHGMDEASIQELRSSDWKDFNSDRRFREHYTKFPEELDWEAPDPYNFDEDYGFFRTGNIRRNQGIGADNLHKNYPSKEKIKRISKK